MTVSKDLSMSSPFVGPLQKPEEYGWRNFPASSELPNQVSVEAVMVSNFLYFSNRDNQLLVLGFGPEWFQWTWLGRMCMVPCVLFALTRVRFHVLWKLTVRVHVEDQQNKVCICWRTLHLLQRNKVHNTFTNACAHTHKRAHTHKHSRAHTHTN